MQKLVCFLLFCLSERGICKFYPYKCPFFVIKDYLLETVMFYADYNAKHLSSSAMMASFCSLMC